ncbi:hypothetical protein [Holospora undulata]|uniref:Uncharacterized protein n=1 Tax=Holospora undulata HU1 TaxID=1321371 RepID=A0A061JIC7_9PROT|nr:hypothetical protein [Holospora undulata]ETZ05293.1 hypothetical protein K737_300269 [Holospora undulata HU1]
MIKKFNKNFFLPLIVLLCSYQGYAALKDESTLKNTQQYQTIKNLNTLKKLTQYLESVFNNYETYRDFIPLVYSKLLSFLVPDFSALMAGSEYTLRQSPQSFQDTSDQNIEKIKARISDLFEKIFAPFRMLRKVKPEDLELVQALQRIYFREFFTKITGIDEEKNSVIRTHSILSPTFPLGWTNSILKIMLVSGFRSYSNHPMLLPLKEYIPEKTTRFKELLKSKYDHFLSNFPPTSENDNAFRECSSFLRTIGDLGFVEEIEKKYSRWK